eukprot:gene25627-31335_t
MLIAADRGMLLRHMIYMMSSELITAGTSSNEEHTTASSDHTFNTAKNFGDVLGVFRRRYRKFIRHYTRRAGDIQRKLEEWHRKWSGCFDPEIGEELFTRGTDDAVRQQLQRIHDIVDIADNHYVKRRSPPKSKHGLQEWTCVRGGKVESLHTEEGHFANQGMHPMLAQALTIEGLVQFTMDKEREVWYDAHQVATPAVGHYKPWLQVEANHLAELVSLPKPYPEQVGIGEDNGEVFLYDYFLQQQEREQLHREEY